MVSCYEPCQAWAGGLSRLGRLWGVENEARDLAIYLLRYIRSEYLEKIGEEFNLNNYSSMSNAISRVKGKLRSNSFKKRYGQILDLL